MLQRLHLYQSPSHDPYFNLALEQYLLTTLPSNSLMLYLWQNSETVVIGRNQNPWAECPVSVLKQDGVKLARRLSGGGSVYHDLGNLNYTFLTFETDFNLPKQSSVVLKACEYAGIEAIRAGRNDFLVHDKKFSGSAFLHSNGKALQHGTMLIQSNLSKMSRYLTPPKSKLHAKGISSVRSRVANLSELYPSLTPAQMKENFKQALESIYQMTSETISLTQSDLDTIQNDARTIAAEQWVFGTTPPFTYVLEHSFSWGQLQLRLLISNGHISALQAFTDALDPFLPDTLEKVLIGCKFQKDALQDALSKSNLDNSYKEGIYRFLSSQQM